MVVSQCCDDCFRFRRKTVFLFQLEYVRDGHLQLNKPFLTYEKRLTVNDQESVDDRDSMI